MGAKEELQDFFDILDTEQVTVFAKRLSANDTGASGAHQSGPYIPREVAFDLCPTLNCDQVNPSASFETLVMSHDVTRVNRLVWYNNASRNECRITRWANENNRESVLQKELTGALVVILFSLNNGEIRNSWTWLCTTPEQEDLLEERLGAVEPGTFIYNGKMSGMFSSRLPLNNSPCSVSKENLPPSWLVTFPEGLQIVKMTFDLLSADNATADKRLVQRRECEYRIFRLIEDAHVIPKIQQGFTSVDSFIELANSVTNRRKSRSGKSFEFHLEHIFNEESITCTRGGRSEGKKSPDFLFPTVDHYHDLAWPSEKIRMLGVKTTCKDRWRQILNEADRVQSKHLITLQEGVSVDQFREMQAANVLLVAPAGLHEKYPKEIRGELCSLERFIAETKAICGPVNREI